MTTQSIEAFRQRVSEDEALHKDFADAYASGAAAVAALGQRHGFHFSAAEASAAMQDGELSDAELELVSGGGPISAPM